MAGTFVDDLVSSMLRLQEELLNSQKSLLPLADHIQSNYGACKTREERAEAFKTARGYVTQALASVAYQVNEGASLLEQLLDNQEAQLKDLNAKMCLPRQVRFL